MNILNQNLLLLTPSARRSMKIQYDDDTKSLPMQQTAEKLRLLQAEFRDEEEADLEMIDTKFDSQIRRSGKRRRTWRSSLFERKKYQRSVGLVENLRILQIVTKRRKLIDLTNSSRIGYVDNYNEWACDYRENPNPEQPMTVLRIRCKSQTKFLEWCVTEDEEESERICSIALRWTNWDGPCIVSYLSVAIWRQISSLSDDESNVCNSGKTPRPYREWNTQTAVKHPQSIPDWKADEEIWGGCHIRHNAGRERRRLQDVHKSLE